MLVAFAALGAGCTTVTTSARPEAAADTERAAPRLARTELVARANAACAARARALAALARPVGRARTRRFFGSVAAIERREFMALAALRPPKAQEADYLRFLAASLELARVSERFHAAVVGNDAHARRRALADAERLSESYDRVAGSLGLACRQTV